MPHRPAAYLLALLALSTALSAGDAAVPAAVPLFDGSTFTGWEGDTVKSFRIEAGAIVGGTLAAKIPRNEFLATTKEYGDFELRVQVKSLGKGVNGGIQLRSKRIPNHHEVSGFQADVGGIVCDTVWGALYDESRRNRFLAKPVDQAALAAAFKPEDWNALVIRAEGPRIRITVNGVPTVDYTETDPAIATRGIICVQIHGGPPSEVWYKDIVITELK